MKLSLSEHTLEVNHRRCDVDLFDWAEVEDYVLALTGERGYQYEAIKSILIYLWGGGYQDVRELAKENYARKQAIQQRFHSEEHFLRMLPLPDRLSGVCHLATGTGKSFVMIAVAHLSLLLGKVQRVLVLGPSSTVIEEGLREKFKEYLHGAKGAELQATLPERLRNKVVRLLTCNDHVEDQSIVIENINAIYARDRNSIGDWFANQNGDVLVLSDEVHHAYSHLKFVGENVHYDFEGGDVGKQGDARDERLWMKFIRDKLPEGTTMARSALEALAWDKVITVISQLGESEYKQKLDEIEQVDPDRVGGKVEYIFAVNKLSEGWDVDNVFQIVPAAERVFNSKLLISQVLGRGLRLPRTIPADALHNRYPVVTVTNHEKFASHIQQLLDEVTECELRLTAFPIADPESKRFKHHFSLFNIEYQPTQRTEPREDGDEPPQGRELHLTPSPEKLGVKVTYLQGVKRFELSKDYFTVDQVVLDVERRFKNTIFEARHFDFGGGVVIDKIPAADDIKAVIMQAMQQAGIESDLLSKENRQQIEIHFNQYLPRGKKRVVRENKLGRAYGLATADLPQMSARAGGLDHEVTAFVSEDFAKDLCEENRFVLDQLLQAGGQLQLGQGSGWLPAQSGYNPEYVRQMVQFRNLYAVNTSLFRTPQELVIARYEPERRFIFRLIEESRLINSWIKSPDSGFYDLDYEYWKAGKDRVRRSFNPDFFIRVNLRDYLAHLPPDEKDMSVERLRSYQDKGIQDLICVIEIKHDDDNTEQTRAKGEAGREHFKALNGRLQTTNPIDFPEPHRHHARQLYGFWILRPAEFGQWFGGLRTGHIVFDFTMPESEK